jgi:hypothetical protein
MDDSEFRRGRLSLSRDRDPDPLGLCLVGGSAKILKGSSDAPSERSLVGRGGRLFNGPFCDGFSGRGGAGRIPLVFGAGFSERFSYYPRAIGQVCSNSDAGGTYEKVARILRHVLLVNQGIAWS